jgi:hypothetical protein
LKSEGLWNILQLQSKMERGALPGAAKRGLFKALILVGAAVDDVQSRGEYWIQVRWLSHVYSGAVSLSLVYLCFLFYPLCPFLTMKTLPHCVQFCLQFNTPALRVCDEENVLSFSM